MQSAQMEAAFDGWLEFAASELEAEHGHAYRVARQAYLRQLLADPNQPRYVRGWVRQELNRLQSVALAKQRGQRGPGGSVRHLRGIPGLDVGHKLGRHNQHRPANFRLEDARFNRARPGISRRLGLFHRYREGEAQLELKLEQAAHCLDQESPDYFFTRVTPIPGIGNKEGHEILTRIAMRGLPLTRSDQAAVELGVIRPDRGGRSYWNFPRAALDSFKAAAQPSHALRPTPSSSIHLALLLIHHRFRRLYAMAMRAKSRRDALAWLGEALHLLQDSFSAAHVDRSGGVGRIRRIRAFFIRFGWPVMSRAPHEHNAPSDRRDDIYQNSVLRPEARAAIAVSRSFLEMALRHLRLPHGPGNVTELNAFIRRHLA